MPGMHARAQRSLSAIADTILPGSSDASSATELGVVDRFEGRFLDHVPDLVDRRLLLLLLRLLDTRIGGLLVHGFPQRFAAMSEARRGTALRRMARSPLPKVRFAFKALKGSVGLLYMTPPPDHTGEWEPWARVGYPPPPAAPVPTPPLETVRLGDEVPARFDVVVIGSGAGGGTAAAALAAAGLSVLVVEKGEYIDREAFPDREDEALEAMYLDRGLATTTGGAVTLLAGATVGGGTVVNYSTALRPADRLLDDWDHLSGFDGVFTGRGFEAAMDAVAERIGVTEDESVPAERDRIMEEGLRRLGWHAAALSRNVRGCDPEVCGMCAMGCRIGAKQSALETWLRDAVAAGAMLVSGAKAQSIVVEDGRAVGVRITAGPVERFVRSRAVVVCAGGLHSAAILIRSGAGGRRVGRGLRLHPVTAVWGRFPQRVEQWTGILQARYSDEFADLDGRGFGFKFETTAVHQSFPPLLLPWESGPGFHEDLAAMAHWSPIGILLRDRSEGRVVVDASGRPSWRYRFDRVDRDHLALGMEKAAAVLAAAGADEVAASTLRPVRWTPSLGGSAARFGKQVRRAGVGSNRAGFVSFHQMASAAMGADPARSVVDAANEVHDTEGLYVMDASAFPNASGANPAFIVQAIAHRAATMLAERMA